MANTAKKIVNTKKTKSNDLKLVEKKAEQRSEDCMSLEELLKVYPGLSLNHASLLCLAHGYSKKTAA